MSMTCLITYSQLNMTYPIYVRLFAIPGTQTECAMSSYMLLGENYAQCMISRLVSTGQYTGQYEMQGKISGNGRSTDVVNTGQ